MSLIRYNTDALAGLTSEVKSLSAQARGIISDLQAGDKHATTLWQGAASDARNVLAQKASQALEDDMTALHKFGDAVDTITNQFLSTDKTLASNYM